MPVKKPAKKPVAKKVAKKVVKRVVKKTNVDDKVNQVKSMMREEAKFVEKESKEIATGLWKWWKHSTTEEKIYSVVWIILLIIGLYILFNNGRWIFVSALFIIIWVLFVNWYFTKRK